MKSTLLILCFIAITLSGFNQEKRVDVNKLFVTNKLTEKSVKLGSSATTLKKFGNIVSIDTNYVDKVNLREILNDSKFLKYTFDDIIFYVDVQNRITTFETSSSNIEITRKGMFSFTPSNSMEEIALIFPDVIQKAIMITTGKYDENKYLAAWIPLNYKPSGKDELVEIDQKIGLLFNPESKLLEKIYIWTRP